MQYTLVEDNKRAGGLIKAVNDMILQGWKPIGGVSTSAWKDDYDNDFTNYVQAMIKE